jgi:hypothetical protein
MEMSNIQLLSYSAISELELLNVECIYFLASYLSDL